MIPWSPAPPVFLPSVSPSPSAVLVPSPLTKTRPCPPRSSTATRLFGSPARKPSRIESAMKSQSLSGCLGETNSQVRIDIRRVYQGEFQKYFLFYLIVFFKRIDVGLTDKLVLCIVNS